MKMIQVDASCAVRLAPLVAAFRVTLQSYRGIVAEPNLEAANEEILSFLNLDYPVFAVEDSGEYLGYIVCKVESPCLWVEHLFVRENVRRRGVATALFEKAEALSNALGEDTLFNYVHPNNEGMIRFLQSKGYTVLNMIEIRKPFKGETPSRRVRVGDHEFDY